MIMLLKRRRQSRVVQRTAKPSAGQLRDNRRGVARETCAQRRRISTCQCDMPVTCKSADFTVVISMVRETSIAHHEGEHVMKEREALKRSRPWKLRQRGRWKKGCKVWSGGLRRCCSTQCFGRCQKPVSVFFDMRSADCRLSSAKS